MVLCLPDSLQLYKLTGPLRSVACVFTTTRQHNTAAQHKPLRSETVHPSTGCISVSVTFCFYCNDVVNDRGMR